jgi:hypothetical protein
MHRKNDLFANFDRDFENMRQRGNYFFAFVALVMFGIFAWNAYQYSQAPSCSNGMLIQDDTGRFVCVPADRAPVILRGNQGFGRRW